MALYQCYIQSCASDSTIGRIHKLHGAVDCCAGHDPARYGQERPMYAEPEEDNDPDDPAPARPPKEVLIAAMFAEMMRLSRDDYRPDDGKRARLIPPKQPLPPTGAAVRTR